MQNLVKLIDEVKKKPNTTNQQIFNLTREYLQVLILKAIYQSKYGKGLCFMGGTALRICYNMKRYSEDLDFTLDAPVAGYSFGELNEIIAGFLKATDFNVELSVKGESTVQKSFIKVGEILHLFNLSSLKGEKLHVKIEVDTNPVKITDKQKETFFVTKFDEIFPILKHKNDTLFAGKILAILARPYAKGRDYYDLVWYLKNGTSIDLDYLKKGCKMAGLKSSDLTKDYVFLLLRKKVDEVSPTEIIKDVGRFLEDPSEAVWLKDYSKVFAQLAKV